MVQGIVTNLPLFCHLESAKQHMNAANTENCLFFIFFINDYEINLEFHPKASRCEN